MLKLKQIKYSYIAIGLCLSTTLLLAQTHQITSDSTLSGADSENNHIYNVDANIQLSTTNWTANTNQDLGTFPNTKKSVVYLNDGSSLNMQNSSIDVTNTAGANNAFTDSHAAIKASGNNILNINSSFFDIDGDYIWAIALQDSQDGLTLSKSTITTNGEYARGVYAYNSTANIIDSTISTTRDWASGVYAQNNSTANITNSNISTNGDYAYGVIALSSTATITNSNISTKGAGAHGVFASNSTATITNSTISTTGNNATGVYADNSTATITNSNISATGNNSFAIYASRNSTANITNSNIIGDIKSTDGGGGLPYASHITMDLNSNYFIGATSYDTDSTIDIEAKNSNLTFTKDSFLTSLKLDASNIYLGGFNDSFDSSPATTLKIDSLSGTGTILQRVDIVGNGVNATNNGDILDITNTSSGNFSFKFNDKKTGNISLDGKESLLVLKQSGNDIDHQAKFTGKMDLGAYTYNVVEGSNKNQYLVKGDKPNNSATSSSSFININSFINIVEIQTLLQRMGEIDINRDNKDDMWIRTYIGKLNDFKSSLRIDDTTYYGIQAGIDRRFKSKSYDANYYLGLMFGYTNANIDYKIGDGEVDSYSAGIYATYKDVNGFYIDGFIKYSYMDNEFDTKTSNKLSVSGDGDTKGVTVSLEVGKRFDIQNSSFYIEPQAQLSYVYQDSTTMKASNNLKTNIDSYNSFLTRVGAIFGYKTSELTNIYYKTGYIANLSKDVDYNFNNDKKLKQEIDGNWWDNAVGITTTLNDKHSLYLEGTYQLGDEFNNTKINAGYRYIF